METSNQKNFDCEINSEELNKIKRTIHSLIEPTTILQKISPRLKKSFEDRAKFFQVKGENNFEILSNYFRF